MKQWFYVKNDLSERKDVEAIIQHPIRSRFGIRRPLIASGNEVQACLMAFNTMCTYIGTRDLVQEHIAYKVWPLVNDWKMPKETASGSNEGGLIYLRYTYCYRSQFDKPNDDWLEVVDATSNELLGAYSKAEDVAMTTAFGARGKRRLNRVFNVIGFFYPDYCFPARKQGLKRKVAALSSSVVSNPKRAKILTRRLKPCPLEKTAAELDTEKIENVEHAKAIPLAPETIPVVTVEASIGLVEEHLKLSNPPTVTELLKLTSGATTTITSKKRRMTSVLDVVLKSTAYAEASDEKIEDVREVALASASSIHVEAGPSGAAPVELVKESLPEKPTSPAPEAPHQGDLDYIVRHASGKRLLEEQIAKVQHYAKDLKYP
jgi:hypothetical protein